MTLAAREWSMENACHNYLNLNPTPTLILALTLTLTITRALTLTPTLTFKVVGPWNSVGLHQHL